MANGLPEFDILRKQARQQAQAQRQEGQEALKRRFARIGALGSGAYIKQAQLGEQAAAEQAGQAEAQIGIAEQQEKQRREESAIERQFREKQFGFQQEQAKTQQQQFAQQFEAQQEQFRQQFGLTKEQAEIDKQIKQQQMQFAKDQFELDRVTQIFNQFSAAKFDPRFLQRFLALYDQTGKIPTAQEISASLAGTDTTTPRSISVAEQRQEGTRTRAGED